MRLTRALLFLPRMFVGTRRYTLPRGFSAHKVLGEGSFEGETSVDRFDPVQGLLEQLRKLYMNLLGSLGEGGAVAICSPNRSEGRSTLGANLAMAMAHDTGRDVTLVDLDLRRPSLHELLELPEGPGVVELAGGAPLDEVLQPTALPQLELLRAGGDCQRPVRLLQSGVLPRLLEGLAHRGRIAVIDTPAVNHFVDASLVARQGVGVVTLVKMHATKKFQLAHYYQKLRGSNFLGVVCNYDEYWIPPWIHRFL